MKRIFLLFLILISVSIYADARMTSVLVGGQTPAVGGSYLLSENFDGSTLCATSYTSTCNNTATVSLQSGVTVDFDNTTLPAPIDGTYSCRVTDTGTNTTNSTVTYSFTAGANRYAYIKANFDAIGTASTNRDFLIFGGVSIYADDGSTKLTVWTGAETIGNYVLSTGTTYHIWAEFEKSSGASDGQYRVYIATTATKPGSPVINKINHNLTSDASSLALVAKRDNNVVFEKIRVSGSAIGSDPS